MKTIPKEQVLSNDPGMPSGGAGSPPKVWRLNGRLMVRETEIDGVQHDRPLAGIEVKVSASDVGANGPWSDWGSVRTDADGDWALSEENNGPDRYFRVEARLVSGDLEVNESKFDDLAAVDLLDRNWRTVWKSGVRLNGPDVAIGTGIFGNGGDDLGDETFRRQALIWYVLRTTIDRLEAEDPWFAMNGKTTAIYPAHTPSKASYANGLLRMIYLAKGDWDVSWRPAVALHEFMHLWNYDHNYGTINWINAVCSLRMSNFIDGTTHGLQENPVVAFAEGFSEWAARALLHQLWGTRQKKPYNRYHVVHELKLSTLEMVERSEHGVEGGLRLLHVGDRNGWWSHLFGTSEKEPENLPDDDGDGEEDHPEEVGIKKRLGGYRVPADAHHLSVWDILRAFRASPHDGWDHDLEVGNRDYGIVRFIERALDIHQLPEDVRLMILRCIDPLGTDEPYEALDRV